MTRSRPSDRDAGPRRSPGPGPQAQAPGSRTPFSQMAATRTGLRVPVDTNRAVGVQSPMHTRPQREWLHGDSERET